MSGEQPGHAPFSQPRIISRHEPKTRTFGRREEKSMTVLRKSITGALAALTLGATVAATATPASADWRGHRGGWHGGHQRGWGGPVAAGVIGGLALGAFAANAGPRYYAPTAGQRFYGGDCFRQDRPTYDRWGRFIGYRAVTVCD
jgi:hypothetical protein